MARTRAAKAAAIEQLILGYERSGMTRQQYSDMHGVPLSTFDYYRRRLRQQQERNIIGQQQLVRVEVARPVATAAEQSRPVESFTVKLAQNRSIEAPWDFREEDLMRLIRIVEAA